VSISLLISGLISDAFCSFSGNGEEMSEILQEGKLTLLEFFTTLLL
jgi:hypothetical protein